MKEIWGDIMNNKGFTLVELLATVVLLAIIVGIVLVSTNGGFKKSKEDTEKVFIDTIKDAMDMYLDSDAKNLGYKGTNCTINKTHKIGVKLYQANDITFNDVINSTYHPLTESDLVNPANDKKCKSTATISIYRDEDFVYYYKIDKTNLDCLTISSDNEENFATNEENFATNEENFATNEENSNTNSSCNNTGNNNSNPDKYISNLPKGCTEC